MLFHCWGLCLAAWAAGTHSITAGVLQGPFGGSAGIQAAILDACQELPQFGCKRRGRGFNASEASTSEEEVGEEEEEEEKLFTRSMCHMNMQQNMKGINVTSPSQALLIDFRWPAENEQPPFFFFY